MNFLRGVITKHTIFLSLKGAKRKSVLADGWEYRKMPRRRKASGQ